MKKEFIGEFIGTFLLVFFGCGAVAGEVLFDSFDGLFQIAAIWGIAVTVAIFVTGPLSGAHLNPAITLAFVTVGEFPKKKLPLYFSAQFAGAFGAAGVLYLLFGHAIATHETQEQIARGFAGSEATAKIFGEFYASTTPTASAFFAEFLGTALLAFAIFALIDKRRATPLPDWLVPLAIGLTLTILISIFAPISMAGFNPARDLAPRIFSAFAGWGSHPFQVNGWSWFTVYVLGPFLGGPAGAWLVKKLL